VAVVQFLDNLFPGSICLLLHDVQFDCKDYCADIQDAHPYFLKGGFWQSHIHSLPFTGRQTGRQEEAEEERGNH